MSRLPKIQTDDLSDEQRRVVAEITAGPRGEVRGPFIPLLHNAKATDAVQRMGSFLRFDGTLPGALREMVILVVARHWTAQYEWFAHHRIALEEGLDSRVADAIAARKRPDFAGAQGGDALEPVYDFVTELHRDHQVSDATFAATQAVLGAEQIVELVVLCGHYNLIAMALNGFGVEVPSGERPLS
ncbi:MAG: carboxymuconolactone decarboxylase family protein [Gammaproteobacteria bacterium]|nr:carboxymuconolactone decarboxylase family protein [Gammaproteobacteria bacterium]